LNIGEYPKSFLKLLVGFPVLFSQIPGQNLDTKTNNWLSSKSFLIIMHFIICTFPLRLQYASKLCSLPTSRSSNCSLPICWLVFERYPICIPSGLQNV